MVSPTNISIASVITSLSMLALFITSIFSISDRLTESEQQVDELTTQLSLMETQIEDKKHENAVTRIMNAKALLDSCQPILENKDEINHILSNAIKLASLEKKFDESEIQLDSVITYLRDCDFFIETIPNTASMASTDSFQRIQAISSYLPLIRASAQSAPITQDPTVNSETNSTTTPLNQGTLLLEVPNDITLYTDKDAGMKIFYSVIGFDFNDGKLSPVCTPSSGTEFHTGDTKVTCKIINSKSEELTKSFKIIIKQTMP